MENYLVSELLHYCNVTLSHYDAIRERTIPYYDFTYVLDGSMTYIVDGREIVLGKDDAIFLRPGMRRARRAGDAPVRFVSFNFLLRDGVSLPFESYLAGCISSDTKRLFSIFSQEHLSPKFHAEQKCVNLLNYILFELLDTELLHSKNEHVRHILKHVEQHPSEDLSLSAMARMVGLTPEYTATIFKRETGKTLSEYVNERRLLLARNEIRNTHKPLQLIADEVGFENYHYFSRLFKKYFNTTPTKTRKHTE